jgi:zinc and cadmium transporter
VVPAVIMIVYCLLILAASLGGGWIPLCIRLTHRRMQLAVSLVAGVMLGVGLLHLLPHALLKAPQAMNAVFGWTLAGFLAMFFIERFFCYHHHEVPHPDDDDAPDDAGCIHGHNDSHSLTWSGAAVGLTLHSVIEGVALAASVQAELNGAHGASLAGLGTFLVIFLHKPFDSMTISTLMTAGGWSMASRHLVNGLFALVVPVGVVLFYLGPGRAGGESHAVAYALAFSAGTFLCISMSDLLPELQFHAHDRVALSLALLLGLSVAWVIGILEGQSHGHHAEPPNVHSDHDGHDH